MPPLLARAIENQAIVFVAQPEARAPQSVDLWSNGVNETALFCQSIDASRPNDVHACVPGDSNSIAIIHQQRLGIQFGRKNDGFTLAAMKTGLTDSVRFGSVSYFSNQQPRCHRVSHPQPEGLLRR